MKIKTKELKKLVNLAYTTSGRDTNYPVTEFITLYTSPMYLNVVATDNINTIRAWSEREGDDDFVVSVDAEKFKALVTKLSATWTVLSDRGKYLEVKCGGTYKVPLPLNEIGESIRYQDVNACKPTAVLEARDISIARFAGWDSVDHKSRYADILNSYFIDMQDGIYSTNGIKLFHANINNNWKSSERFVINPKAIDILDKLNSDIEFAVCGDCIKFQTSGGEHSGAVLRVVPMGIGLYPTAMVKNCLGAVGENKCTFDKASMLSALGRASLFSSDYSNNEVAVFIERDKIVIKSLHEESVESITCTADESTYFKVNSKLFASLINSSERGELRYGATQMVGVVSQDFTAILALSNA